VLTLQANGQDDRTPAGASGSTVCLLTSNPPQVRFTVSAEAGELNRKRRWLVISHTSDDRIIAIIEIVSRGNKASRNPFRTFVENALGAIDAGINLLIVDLFPPSERDPRGIHWALWQEIDNRNPYTPPPDKLRTLVSDARNPAPMADVEPVAVGDVLIDMPLFLDVVSYVKVPLEATYRMAIPFRLLRPAGPNFRAITSNEPAGEHPVLPSVTFLPGLTLSPCPSFSTTNRTTFLPDWTTSPT
jgi:hypothetical protein